MSWHPCIGSVYNEGQWFSPRPAILQGVLADSLLATILVSALATAALATAVLEWILCRAPRRHSALLPAVYTVLKCIGARAACETRRRGEATRRQAEALRLIGR